MDKNYDSYCGIYCGACDIMKSYKTGEKSKLASFWNEVFLKKYYKKFGIVCENKKSYEIKCNGCKSNTLFINCDTCKIRKCAIENKIEHCLECSKYPCNFINELNSIKSLLPHLKTNHENMERVKSVGVEKWLEEQEKRWRCPKCSREFSWYSSKCSKCGENLKKLSFKFSFLQALVLKIGILCVKKK